MTPRRQYVDPPGSAHGVRLHTRDEVLEVERWAWAGKVSSRRAEFFYDGIDFWQQLRSGRRRMVHAVDAPASSWWHRPACNCRLCQARIRDGSRELAGREARR